jgi:hypothetical protein
MKIKFRVIILEGIYCRVYLKNAVDYRSKGALSRHRGGWVSVNEVTSAIFRFRYSCLDNFKVLELGP